jgi:hypothetical protein
MPYITKDRRDILDRYVIRDLSSRPNNEGELNYLFTRLAMEYLNFKGHTYTHMGDVIGALENAKLEFYRRIVAPYEDLKRTANGDVFFE